MLIQTETIPKVSVCVITYNQDKFVRQCLQSIVAQKTDFDYEVIVGDDCSTDGTSAIVQEFVNKYPDIVRAVFQATNIGGTKNYLATHSLARGEYIAHIDGDDLMLPGRLLRQARYLDDNPKCAAVWHRVKTISGDDRISEPAPASTVESVSQRIVLQRGFAAHHSSLMYRRAMKPTLRASGEILDFHISVELLKNGDGAILPEILGVYRQGVGTMTSDRSQMTRLAKDQLDYYLSIYPEYSFEINRCAFSLFVRELVAGRRGAILLLHTFLISMNIRTPLGILSECVLLTRRAIAKLFARIV